MKASLKKLIERNIRDLVAVGTTLPATDRETGAAIGVVTVISVSRDEIRGRIDGESFGWNGFETSFRVPELTQRGGNLKIDTACLALA
jgi:hypothetical protein